MATQCNEAKLIFHDLDSDLDSREVVGRFDGGEITSDAGAVLLREVEKRTRVLGRMSECFEDGRDPDRIEHTVESLVNPHGLARLVEAQHPPGQGEGVELAPVHAPVALLGRGAVMTHPGAFQSSAASAAKVSGPLPLTVNR